MKSSLLVTGRFRPLDSRARWAVIGLIAVIITDGIAIGSDWLEIRAVNDILGGETVSVDSVQRLSSSDDRQAIASVLELAAIVASAVLFIRWFRAAYENLASLGQPNLRFGSGWAIGAWFVPILNFWRPKQIANDIWRGSNPDADTFGLDGWKAVPVSGLLAVWWTAWIVGVLVGNGSAREWFSADKPRDIRDADIFDIAALTVDAVAAVLAILVVRRLTARQQERERGYELSAVEPTT